MGLNKLVVMPKVAAELADGVNLYVGSDDLARGQMERVANQVYLLTPTNVEVSAEERRRLHERGYDS